MLPADLSLGQLTPESAYDLYLAETQRISHHGRLLATASHQEELRVAKRLFRWTVEKKYLSASPFEPVKPIDRPNVGKPQLRLDEARKLSDLLIHHAASGDMVAAALLMQLTLGLRSSEVLGRKV